MSLPMHHAWPQQPQQWPHVQRYHSHAWHQQQPTWPTMQWPMYPSPPLPSPPPPPSLSILVDAVVGGLQRSGALRTLVDDAVRARSITRAAGASEFLGHVRLRFVDQDRWLREQEEGRGNLFRSAVAEADWQSMCRADEEWADVDEWGSSTAERTLNAVLPLHALRIVPRAPLPREVATAVVEGTAELAAAARTLLESVATLRRALVPKHSPAAFAELVQFHSHFRADTDEFDAMLRGLCAEEAAMVVGVQALLTPLADHIQKKVIAPLLGCPATRLRCPRRAWLSRLFGTAQNRLVHQDMAGAGFDGWLNVWVLLSDGFVGRPLVMLDPEGLEGRELSWRGKRVLTPARARRGDMIVWRSNLVPHATGLPVNPRSDTVGGADDGEEEAAEEPSWEAAERQRSSFDMRCECTEGGDHEIAAGGS